MRGNSTIEIGDVTILNRTLEGCREGGKSLCPPHNSSNYCLRRRKSLINPNMALRWSARTSLIWPLLTCRSSGAKTYSQCNAFSQVEVMSRTPAERYVCRQEVLPLPPLRRSGIWTSSASHSLNAIRVIVNLAGRKAEEIIRDR